MLKREKIAILSAITYIVIMGIGMITLSMLGFNYGEASMVKVLIYFEIIMSILAFVVYKKLNLNVLSKKVAFTKWIIPFILLFILILVFLVFTGDFDDYTFLIILVALTTLLVGFSEELMFRGIVLNVMLEKRGMLFAIIVSAATFSLLHSVNVFGGLPILEVPLQLFLTFIFGVIFSCLAIYIKNIVPLILYHFIWDFAIFSETLTGANVQWLFALAIIIQIIIVMPILIYTVKAHSKNSKKIRNN